MFKLSHEECQTADYFNVEGMPHLVNRESSMTSITVILLHTIVERILYFLGYVASVDFSRRSLETGHLTPKMS
jgi:hypothetical protein